MIGFGTNGSERFLGSIFRASTGFGFGFFFLDLQEIKMKIMKDFITKFLVRPPVMSFTEQDSTNHNIEFQIMKGKKLE